MEHLKAEDFLSNKMSWCFPINSPAHYKVIELMNEFGKIKWDEAQRAANDFRKPDGNGNYPAKTRTPYK